MVRGQLAALLISPSSALTICILIVLLGVWRELAVIDSASAVKPRGAWRRGRSLVTVSLVTVLIAVTHVWAGLVAYAFYDAGTRIFVGVQRGRTRARSSGRRRRRDSPRIPTTNTWWSRSRPRRRRPHGSTCC